MIDINSGRCVTVFVFDISIHPFKDKYPLVIKYISEYLTEVHQNANLGYLGCGYFILSKLIY